METDYEGFLFKDNTETSGGCRKATKESSRLKRAERWKERGSWRTKGERKIMQGKERQRY
jgi:hypothetical protein